MADYSGYFLKGLGSGLQSGIAMGTQLQELKWQKAQRKKLEERQNKLIEEGNFFSAKVKEFDLDGKLSDDEERQLITLYLSGGYEFQEHYKNAITFIINMKNKELEQEFAWMDSFIDMTAGYDPASIPEIYDSFEKQFIKTEKSKNLFAANKIIQEKKYKTGQAPKEVTPYEFYGQSPASVQAGIAESVVGQTAGLGGIQFKEPTVTPAKPAISDYNSAANYLSKFINADPATFNKIKAGLQKNTGLDLSDITQQSLKEPEKAVTVKTKVVDPNDVLFGTNGIMKDYINTGVPLGEEQKTEIKNNYNLIKPSLSKEVRIQVEDYLKQIGIDLTETTPIPEPMPEPTTSKPSWLGGIWNKMTKPGGTPAYKGTPQVSQQQKDYTTMTADELADLALFGDTLAIEELKRRGLI